MILNAETIESCKNMMRSEGSGIHVRGQLCPEDGCAPHWDLGMEIPDLGWEIWDRKEMRDDLGSWPFIHF